MRSNTEPKRQALWVLVGGGAVVGLLSGLEDSTGPLGGAAFLSLILRPVAYIASEATTAIRMHGVKTIIYQQGLPLCRSLRSHSIGLGVAMTLETWAARRVTERVPQVWFERRVATLLVLVGLEMLAFGQVVVVRKRW